MKIIIKYLTFSILLLLSFSGCEYKKYSADVTIERDGTIYSAMPDEINESNEDIEYLKERLNSELSYIDEYGNEKIIDRDIYNFSVVIPIKTKSNLYDEFNQHSNYFREFFDLYRCGKKDEMTAYITYNHIKDINETYHYKLYEESNWMKRKGFFDNIDDICIKYDRHDREYSYRTDYTSNEIIIKAQEIKDMLDNLGIYYEDESN